MGGKRKRSRSRSRASTPPPPSAREKRRRANEASTAARAALPAAVVALRALRTPGDAAADALEWLGDAVLGELVGRCLLAQFGAAAPLSARVFRCLRLGAVSNRNLARAFDLLGYGGARRSRTALKPKDQADVVEAVVGELALRRASGGPGNEQRALVGHLDALLAAVLRAHFADRARWQQQRQQRNGAPLAVAFNPFACLPQEQLDENTGALVVLEAEPELQLVGDEKFPSRSAADLVDEYAVGCALADSGRHHAFPDQIEDAADALGDGSVRARTRTALRCVQAADHILRASREAFEVFKIYGMAVLAERVSLALALPRLARLDQLSSVRLETAPAELTRARQRVLAVSNLATCALALGVASPLAADRVTADADNERVCANTLRAFVGFHSTAATASASTASQSNRLVDDICQYLQEAVPGLVGSPVKLPKREPLTALALAVGEARTFVRSQTCDELHTPGERPPALVPVKKSVLLRHIDSDEVEDLFELLARDVERHEQAQRRRAEDDARARRRPKRVRARTDGPERQQGQLATLERFLHRRFLFCLEELVVLFAQRKTDECRTKMALFQLDLEPCAQPEGFRKWDVSTSTLTLAMRDSFFRLLLHDLSQFHALVSSSRTTRDGTRITQLRLPMHYTWAKAAGSRITDEARAIS